MLKGATRREFDMIAAWSVDRLGRSLQHLVAFLGEVHAAGVDLYLHQQSVDTSTPAGKAMFKMLRTQQSGRDPTQQAQTSVDPRPVDHCRRAGSVAERGLAPEQ